MKKSSKKKFAVIAALVAIGSVGLTYAYFQTSDIFINKFDVAKYAPTIEENFESPSDWVPGMTTPKTVEVTNNGSIPLVVRVSYEEYWKNKNNEDLPLTDKNGNIVAIINFNNDGKWKKVDNYYYYIEELVPSAKTTSFINSVTFNKDYDLDGALVSTINDSDENSNNINDTKTITYSTSNESHVGGSYHLDIKVETMQADQALVVWGIDISLLNEKEEGPFKYIIRSTGVTITGYNIEKGGVNVKVPEQIEHRPVIVIGANAFNNTSIESLSLPSTLKMIEEKAFYKSTKLTSVEIPSSVKTIGANAFDMNLNLTSLILHEGLENIGKSAFRYSKLSGTLEIPSTVKIIEDGAFHNVTRINTLILHEGLEIIENSAFGANGLTGTLEIPSSVKTIGANAFSSNSRDGLTTGIEKLILHEGLESIDSSAFIYQSINGTLEIPSTVKKIGESVFYSCPIDNLILNKGIISIGRNAFVGTNIDSVEIPDTLIELGSYYNGELISPFNQNVSIVRK